MSRPAVLEVKSLSYRYGQKTVLKNVGLDVTGGFVSIIGPNGAGKTTLLKLACGLLDAQQGEIFIGGTSLQELSHLQRARIFTVVQQKQFFPFPFTCMELVALGRYPHRKSLQGLDAADYRVVVKVMEETDTLQFKDQLVTAVSGGEQQRVILACALAQQPRLLFLDEPFAAMDISYQARMMTLLKRLVQETGLTIVSILHDLNLAYRYSDRVCILKNGEMIDYGRPHDVMTEDVISSVFDVNLGANEGRCFQIRID